MGVKGSRIWKGVKIGVEKQVRLFNIKKADGKKILIGARTHSTTLSATTLNSEDPSMCCISLLHLTLSCLAAVHSEVGGLVGLESCLLHSWTIHLDLGWVAALSNNHLYTQTQYLAHSTMVAT